MAIALRYIPDVQVISTKSKSTGSARNRDVRQGKTDGSNQKCVSHHFPIDLYQYGRIDTVSNAMELRGYGKNKKRTWYMGRKLAKADYAVMIVTLVVMVIALVVTYHDGSRFYNPFI